jgi:hypothetical protein
MPAFLRRQYALCWLRERLVVFGEHLTKEQGKEAA